MGEDCFLRELNFEFVERAFKTFFCVNSLPTTYRKTSFPQKIYEGEYGPRCIKILNLWKRQFRADGLKVRGCYSPLVTRKSFKYL